MPRLFFWLASSTAIAGRWFSWRATEPPWNDTLWIQVQAELLTDAQERVNAYFDAQAGYWGQIYARSDVFAYIIQQRLIRVLDWVEQLCLPRGSTILDAGSGAGLASVALAQRGFHVQAIDAAPEMAELTRLNARKAGVEQQVTVRVASVHDLPFASNSFPLVISLGVIPWITAPEKAVQELARVVQPGGHVLLTADNRWRLHYLLNPQKTPLRAPLQWAENALRRGFGLSLSGPLNRLYSTRQLNGFLRAAGLETVHSNTLGFGPFAFFQFKLRPPSRAIRLHEWLQSRADRGTPFLRSAGGHYLALAKKSDVAQRAHQ